MRSGARGRFADPLPAPQPAACHGHGAAKSRTPGQPQAGYDSARAADERRDCSRASPRPPDRVPKLTPTPQQTPVPSAADDALLKVPNRRDPPAPRSSEGAGGTGRINQGGKDGLQAGIRGTYFKFREKTLTSRLPEPRAEIMVGKEIADCCRQR